MKRLTAEKEQQIKASFGRQNLMKLFNASVEKVSEGFFEISVPIRKR
jgi:hypothetical protein